MFATPNSLFARMAACAIATAAALAPPGWAGFSIQQSRPAQGPLERAAALERQGDFAGAARAIEAVLASEPANKSLLRKAGVLWSLADYYEAAEKYLSQLADAEPNDRETWLALGEARFRGQQFQMSIIAFERAAALGDADGRASNGKGAALFSLGDRENAKPLFERAAKANPRLLGPRHSLGRISLDSNEINDAIRWFQECLSLDPRDADSHFRLGLALRRSGNLNDSVKSFESAIADDPLQLGARMNLGQVLLLLGREPEGRAAIEAHGIAARGKQQLTFAMNSLKLDPSAPQARVAVGEALLDLGIAGEALLHFREALRGKHAPIAALRGAARACAALGDAKGKNFYASTALELLAKDPNADSNLVKSLQELAGGPGSAPGR